MLPNTVKTDNAGLELTADILEEIFTNPDFPPAAQKLAESLAQSGKSRADLWNFAQAVAVERGINNNNDLCDEVSQLSCVMFLQVSGHGFRGKRGIIFDISNCNFYPDKDAMSTSLRDGARLQDGADGADQILHGSLRLRLPARSEGLGDDQAGASPQPSRQRPQHGRLLQGGLWTDGTGERGPVDRSSLFRDLQR